MTLEQALQTIAQQQEVIAKLQATVTLLESEVKELRARLERDSRSSSAPPSSDTPWKKHKRTVRPTGRASGGQKGHTGHSRRLHREDEISEHQAVYPAQCMHCQGSLCGEASEGSTPLDVVDLPDKPLVQVTRYHLHRMRCARCGKRTSAQAPGPSGASPFGPRVQAMVGMLTVGYRVSRQASQSLMHALGGVTMSTGSLSAIQRRLSARVEQPVEQATRALQQAPSKHMDETPWYQGHQLGWLWVLCDETTAVFRIQPRRDRQAAHPLSGGPDRSQGIVHVDHYSVYADYGLERRQLCWAHVMRTWQAMAEGSDPAVARVARSLLYQGQKLFRVHHKYRQDELSAAVYAKHVQRIYSQVHHLLSQGGELSGPKTGSFRSLLHDVDALFTFFRHPHLALQLTNNQAERMLRHAVCYRKVSLGTRSEAGSRFVERMLSVWQTLRMQGRDVMQFLVQALQAYRLGLPPPSLIAAH